MESTWIGSNIGVQNFSRMLEWLLLLLLASGGHGVPFFFFDHYYISPP